MAYRPVTSIAQPNSVTYGSCGWEYSSDGINWNPLGVARGVKFTENIETSKIQTDNGPDISNAVGDHTVTISANLLEFYPTALTAIRGGIDSLSITTAEATTDTDVYTTGSWYRNRPYYFQNQGATDTLPAIITVKSVSAGAVTDTLKSTADYSTFTDENNRSGIIVLSTAVGGGDTGLTSQSLRIEYEYGAIEAVKWTAGGLDTIGAKYHRLTNARVIDGVIKYKYFVIYSGTITKGLDLAFKSSNESDPVLESPFEIMAKLDTSRTVGDQLFYIEDEQSVA